MNHNVKELQVGEEMEYFHWQDTYAVIQRKIDGYHLFAEGDIGSPTPLFLGVFDSLEKAQIYYTGE